MIGCAILQTFRDGVRVQFRSRASNGDGYIDLVSSGDDTDDEMPNLVEPDMFAPRTSHVDTAPATPAAAQRTYRIRGDSPLTAFAESIPEATRVVDLTTRVEQPRIDMLRRIHLQEMSEGFILDPSWCACPNCEYSRGDLRAQRYTVMKRLYQLNAAIYGPLTNQHVTEYELLKTLI